MMTMGEDVIQKLKRHKVEYPVYAKSKGRHGNLAGCL